MIERTETIARLGDRVEPKPQLLFVDVVARVQTLNGRARELSVGLQGEIDRVVGTGPQPPETYGPRDVSCFVDAVDVGLDELTNSLNHIENSLIRLQAGLG